MGRCLARTAQQLPVVVLVEVYRPAGLGRVVILGRGGKILVGGVRSWTVVPAIPLASRQTVRVTAEAGVATFHPRYLLDLAVQPCRGTLLPLPLECRSIEIPCMT
jgi:hypothetical protein